MTAYFPAVGLLIGLLLVVVHWTGSRLWPPMMVALLDTLFLAVVTGAFHIDGLGDSADGLFSHRDRRRALEIMKDSRLGTMGLLCIVSILLVKWSALVAIGATTPVLLIVVPALARGAMLLGIWALPYARAELGTGHGFFQQPLSFKDFRWLLVAGVLTMLLGWVGVRLLLCFGVINGMLLMFYRRRLAGITGDMLGAMVEVNEAFLFLGAAMGSA